VYARWCLAALGACAWVERDTEVFQSWIDHTLFLLLPPVAVAAAAAAAAAAAYVRFWGATRDGASVEDAVVTTESNALRE